MRPCSAHDQTLLSDFRHLGIFSHPYNYTDRTAPEAYEPERLAATQGSCNAKLSKRDRELLPIQNPQSHYLYRQGGRLWDTGGEHDSEGQARGGLGFRRDVDHGSKTRSKQANPKSFSNHEL